MFKELIKYKDILMEFIIRDIKIKYRRSYLGVLWSLLNPLFTMLVMTAIFSTLFKSSIKNFPVYLLSGQIMIIYFSEATNQAMNSIISNAPLIRKIYIPKYLFCLSKILSSGVTLLSSFIAMLIVAFFTGIKFNVAIFGSIFPMLYLMIFALGIGYILATLAVFFRDITHLYNVFLLIWSYLTPTFYPVEILPNTVRTFVNFNPLAIYAFMMRDSVLYGKFSHLSSHGLGLSIALITFAIGYSLFKKSENKFILYI